MEQRRFCAKCNAPAVKGMDVCVVCGGTEFILPQVEAPVRVVEIEDAVVKAPVDSKFIKASSGEEGVVKPAENDTVIASQDLISEQETDSDSEVNLKKPLKQRPATTIPKEGRTVVYKSFEEYEKELAEKETTEGFTDSKKKDKPKKGFKKVGFVFLCIFLSLVLVFTGFVAGVYLTYTGALDEVISAIEPKIDEKYQTEIDTCDTYKTELAEKLLGYVTANGIYIDETVTVVIECVEDADFCLVTVDNDCLSAAEIEALLGSKYMCPTRGTYVVQIIPFEDEEGNGKLRVEVVCDGESGGFAHS